MLQTQTSPISSVFTPLLRADSPPPLPASRIQTAVPMSLQLEREGEGEGDESQSEPMHFFAVILYSCLNSEYTL